MHKVLVNHLGGLSLPRKSVVRLTDRPNMTLDVSEGHKTTNQQQQQHNTEKELVVLSISVLSSNHLLKAKIAYSISSVIRGKFFPSKLNQKI